MIELAKEHPEQAVRNSATLRHFAVEVFAYDIAVPGIGCSGVLPVASVASSSATASATAAPSSVALVSSEAAVPTSTVTPPVSTVSSAATECHTHADGVVHCA